MREREGERDRREREREGERERERGRGRERGERERDTHTHDQMHNSTSSAPFCRYKWVTPWSSLSPGSLPWSGVSGPLPGFGDLMENLSCWGSGRPLGAYHPKKVTVPRVTLAAKLLGLDCVPDGNPAKARQWHNPYTGACFEMQRIYRHRLHNYIYIYIYISKMSLKAHGRLAW